MSEGTPIVIVAILMIAFILIDGVASKPEPFYGTVVDKHYKAERTSIATGPAVGTDGTMGVVTTSDFDPEEFLIMVKTEKGNIVTVTCEPELYYQKEVGERIDCTAYKGLFTGMVRSLRGVR